MSHVVLLGDSIFDNARYTRGEPDVVSHLRQGLPQGWQASLLAEDGAIVSRVLEQNRHVPSSATHLVLSAGGNDALQAWDLLAQHPRTRGQTLEAFAVRLAPFEQAYRALVTALLRRDRPVVVCTIYNGAFESEQAETVRMGVALFNDVILRTAADLRVDVLELRQVCTEPSDYANPIEPSGTGGLKIARAIAVLIGAAPATPAPARLWGRTAVGT